MMLSVKVFPYSMKVFSYTEPQKTISIQKLMIFCRRTGKEDWDGEGAVAITQQTADTARYLADFFLSFNINPDVSESPYGEIDFDFQLSKNESFHNKRLPRRSCFFCNF